MKEVNLDKNYLQGLFGVVFIPESYKLIREKFQKSIEGKDVSKVDTTKLEFSYFSMVIEGIKRENGYGQSDNLSDAPMPITEIDASTAIQKLPIFGI